MADNLKILKQNLDNAINPNALIGGILAQDHNDVFTEFINKSGKYTGFSYKSVKESDNNVYPPGILSWNSNSFNDINEFVITVSQLTQDLNDIGHILNLMNVNSIIHFKDFVGRSVLLKYVNHYKGKDDNGNIIYVITVKGVIDNANYTYQVNEKEDCVIDFYVSVMLPKNYDISNNFTAVNTQYDDEITIVSDVTLTLNESLMDNFRLSLQTIGGILTIVADTNCDLRIEDGTLVQNVTLQDIKHLTIGKIGDTSTFNIIGDID